MSADLPHLLASAVFLTVGMVWEQPTRKRNRAATVLGTVGLIAATEMSHVDTVNGPYRVRRLD